MSDDPELAAPASGSVGQTAEAIVQSAGPVGQAAGPVGQAAGPVGQSAGPVGQSAEDDAAENAIPLASDLPARELRRAVEALLFIATKPMTAAKLAECLPGVSENHLTGLLEGLAARYDLEDRGWELRRIAHGWQLMTRPACHAWARQLDRKELPTKLSKGAIETLAIVAYRQPITRGDIEDIRGVQCAPVLRQLMDLRLVQVTGRAEKVLGQPLLYGTTEQFLSRFGLSTLDGLPRAHEFGR